MSSHEIRGGLRLEVADPRQPEAASAQKPRDGEPFGVADHQLLRRIGRGQYGQVWLARNVMGEYRAVKIVCRKDFESGRPFEREFNGIRRFEPVSRSEASQVQILHIGMEMDISIT